MRARAALAASLALSLLAAAPGRAVAQPPADSARRAALAALPADAFVRLREASGARRQGTVIAVRGDSLQLRDTWRGRPYAIAIARVDSLQARGARDRSQGIVVGALVGAALGSISAGFADSGSGVGPAVVVGALVNGLVGGALGYALSAHEWRQVWPTPAAPAAP
jgi:hypothetical protein